MKNAQYTVFAVALILIGVYAGNRDGDQSTLRDCATKGVAKMLGGGTITCAVLRDGAAK